MSEMLEQASWSHVKQVLLGWPGERGMTEKTWEGYFDGLHKRADPVEVEEVLRDMRDHDERGSRPPLGLVIKAISARRQRLLREREHARQREHEAKGSPLPALHTAPNQACVDILLHAQRVGYSIAPAAILRWSACTGMGLQYDLANVGLYAAVLWARNGGFGHEALYGDPLAEAAWAPPYTALWPDEMSEVAERSDRDDVVRSHDAVAAAINGCRDHDERLRLLLGGEPLPGDEERQPLTPGQLADILDGV